MEISRIPRIVIAGVQSGVGKTTVATGLMAALAGKGCRVQGFKVGPDFIDPGFHTAATGNISRNLDSWMFSARTIRELFARSAGTADIAVIEGVMGLYDGCDGTREAGSTAQVAKILEAPVILVIDARGMARSAAAMALGYVKFDPRVKIGGCIFNNVGSEGHYRLLKEAVEASIGLPAVGYLIRNRDLKMPERHLGLVPTAEKESLSSYLESLADLITASLDLERILEIARSAPGMPAVSARIFPGKPREKAVRIAVARDKAFNFYYQDSLELLEACGAELVYFSPLADARLPEDIHGLYIGGGFPEMFLKELAGNQAMKESLKRAAGAGMPLYAECGGLMYLAEAIVDFAGQAYPMVGIIPGKAQMQKKLEALGYKTGEVQNDNILAKKGDKVRGHEFHWSRLTSLPETLPAAYRLSGGKGKEDRAEGFVLPGNVLASYLHLHFAAHPRLARNFVASCRRFKRTGGLYFSRSVHF